MVSAAERLASNFDLSLIGKAPELRQRLKFVLEKLRSPVEERRGELSVRRLRPDSKQFVVKVGERYRLIYHRVTPSVVIIDDIVRVDHLRALEG